MRTETLNEVIVVILDLVRQMNNTRKDVLRGMTAEEATRKFEAFCLRHEQSDTPKPKPGQLFLENDDLSFRFEGVNEATKRTATDFLLMFVVMFDAKMKDSIEYVFLTESWNGIE